MVNVFLQQQSAARDHDELDGQNFATRVQPHRGSVCVKSVRWEQLLETSKRGDVDEWKLAWE